MSNAVRDNLFARYDDGPRRLRAAWDQLPAGARQWRPGPDKWSAHEVVVHCADSETNAGMRIRYLIGEDATRIVGYDEAEWARRMDYHTLSVDLAFRQIEAVRAWTSAFVRGLPDAAWARAGTHTQHDGAYSAARWLEVYAEHLETHERQILRNLAGWSSKPG